MLYKVLVYTRNLGILGVVAQFTRYYLSTCYQCQYSGQFHSHAKSFWQQVVAVPETVQCAPGGGAGVGSVLKL